MRSLLNYLLPNLPVHRGRPVHRSLEPWVPGAEEALQEQSPEPLGATMHLCQSHLSHFLPRWDTIPNNHTLKKTFISTQFVEVSIYGQLLQGRAAQQKGLAEGSCLQHGAQEAERGRSGEREEPFQAMPPGPLLPPGPAFYQQGSCESPIIQPPSKGHTYAA